MLSSINRTQSTFDKTHLSSLINYLTIKRNFIKLLICYFEFNQDRIEFFHILGQAFINLIELK